MQLTQGFRSGIVSPILALFVRGQGLTVSQIGLIGTASMIGWLIFEPVAGVNEIDASDRMRHAGRAVPGARGHCRGAGTVMIRRRTVLRLALAAPLLAILAACGKKGPPKRPDGSTGMKIDPAKLKKKKAGQ